MPSVRSSANFLAADWAARMREGATSVAFIDRDTSITRMTVALLRGTCRSACGPASATISRISDTSSRAIGTCRQRLRCGGATRSSSSRLAKV